MAWTDNMVESLKKMWKQGMTTGEIGKKLGVSKNSVVGKVHRLKLDGRPSPIKKKEDLQPASKTKPAVANISSKPSLPKEKPAEIKKPVQSAAPAKTSAAAPAPKSVQAPKPIQPLATPAPAALIKKPVIEKTAYQPKFPLKEETDLFAFCKPEKAKGGKLTVTDLDNHACRWPLGDPKDEGFHFCGKKVRTGQTYCEEHSSIAYVKNNVKK